MNLRLRLNGALLFSTVVLRIKTTELSLIDLTKAAISLGHLNILLLWNVDLRLILLDGSSLVLFCLWWRWFFLASLFLGAY